MSAYLLDVEDPAAIKSFAGSLLGDYPGLNVIINNAGVMRYEDMTSARDLGDAEAMVMTNLLGPIRMIDAFVSHLAGQPGSAIVTLSSGLAFVPMIAAPTYNATKAAIHSYSLSLREQLRGKVEVIEIIPPAVQTDLTPGQATRDGYLPLETFVDQVMAKFRQQPTPEEIVVERARILRDAEREFRFQAVMKVVNPD